jgi:hypothetical protein
MALSNNSVPQERSPKNTNRDTFLKTAMDSSNNTMVLHQRTNHTLEKNLMAIYTNLVQTDNQMRVWISQYMYETEK